MAVTSLVITNRQLTLYATQLNSTTYDHPCQKRFNLNLIRLLDLTSSLQEAEKTSPMAHEEAVRQIQTVGHSAGQLTCL